MTEARTALIFPGQGSQRPGMLDSIPENDTLERLLDAAEALAGLELRALAESDTPSPEELSDTRVAQPLLYLADWAWGVAVLESGVLPVALAGHSLGELAALALAGVFSVEAGLELVVERSKLMASTAAATPGSMAAVLGLTGEAVSSTVKGMDDVWLANDNSPGQVVISGTIAGIAAAGDRLTEAGARRIVPLKVAGPFHSPLMAPARDEFEKIVLQAEFRDASIPVLQNTEPSPATDAEVIRERLLGQITAPVRWVETMRSLGSHGPVVLVECGPGAVLKGLARGMDDITAISVEESGLETTIEEVLNR